MSVSGEDLENPIEGCFEEPDFRWLMGIEKADNGFIFYADSGGTKYKQVLQEQESNVDNNQAEVILTRQLLWEVIEYFNLYKSKHEKYKVEVRILENETGEDVSDEKPFN